MLYKVKQEELAMQDDNIIDRAAVSENYQCFLRINRVSTLKCGVKMFQRWLAGCIDGTICFRNLCVIDWSW